MPHTSKACHFVVRLSRKRCGCSRLHRESHVLRRRQWKLVACRSLQARVSTSLFSRCIGVDLWDNPNAFDPDRFATDRVKTRSRYAFLPFGGGPRVCIGAGFAMIEAAIIL